jgi:hypothetical protein
MTGLGLTFGPQKPTVFHAAKLDRNGPNFKVFCLRQVPRKTDDREPDTTRLQTSAREQTLTWPELSGYSLGSYDET